MNTLSFERRCAVIRALVEGCSIQKLTIEMGEACLAYQDNVLRNLQSKRVQCDEIWCFCYAKDRNLPDAMRGQPGVGSIWTWTALDADSKLMISWRLGARDAANAHSFMSDVASRLANRVQMTTDGNRTYLDAVENNFGSAIDYAQLVKIYGPDAEPETRYSPGRCLGADKRRIMGQPDLDHVSTSFAERQNLNIRMQNRRYTRLTNAFSKKAEMLAYSVAITFMYHNFVRWHQTLRTTPAIAAGVDNHRWTVEEMVDLVPHPARI